MEQTKCPVCNDGELMYDYTDDHGKPHYICSECGYEEYDEEED